MREFCLIRRPRRADSNRQHRCSPAGIRLFTVKLATRIGRTITELLSLPKDRRGDLNTRPPASLKTGALPCSPACIRHFPVPATKVMKPGSPARARGRMRAVRSRTSRSIPFMCCSSIGICRVFFLIVTTSLGVKQAFALPLSYRSINGRPGGIRTRDTRCDVVPLAFVTQ